MKEKLNKLMSALNKAFIARRKLYLNRSQAFGLYVGQPQVLNYVRQHPGCTQIEIAENLGVSSASIAFSTKRLQKAGLLQKQINSLNMRCNKLYVTPEGESVLDNFRSAYDEMNSNMFEGFTAEDLDQLLDYTERFIQNIEKMTTED